MYREMGLRAVEGESERVSLHRHSSAAPIPVVWWNPALGFLLTFAKSDPSVEVEVNLVCAGDCTPTMAVSVLAELRTERPPSVCE